ncbi:hypothetical protein DPMN_014748 [Dreissena polymorpha]|uniref:Uncharacterized protein n=1 Tax=Dreissena polymorpha TaxID=45954 RepID=A0A9D4N9Y7_DREPO|nr:hypothetical protein DPMN_014748 [Dreissena polymorpha]
MSKKRKLEQSMEKENFVALPQTLREVAQLPNSDLNNILRHFSLPVKGKRNHRVTLVANHLNKSTSGGDLHENDVFLQTLDDVKNLKDGWTSDIRHVSELKLHLILRYLLASHDIRPSSPHCAEFSKDSLKCYKGTEIL